MAALVPLALVAGAVLKIVEGNPRLPVVLGGLIALGVFVWCLRTLWRLVSGGSRSDGGLRSPWFIAAAGVAGITSVLLVMMLSGPRVFLAMARDGLVPKGFFADIHPRFRTPWKSTILIGFFVMVSVWGLVNIRVGTFNLDKNIPRLPDAPTQNN